MTIKREMAGVIMVLAVAIGGALLAPGCGSPPGQNGTTTLDDVDVDWNDLGGVHHYNDTTCPQTAGTVLLTNRGANAQMVDLTESSTQLDVYVVSSTGGVTPFSGPVSLAAGEQLELQVRFNCSATTDVHQSLHVVVTPPSGPAASYDIPFDLDIQGAP